MNLKTLKHSFIDATVSKRKIAVEVVSFSN